MVRLLTEAALVDAASALARMDSRFYALSELAGTLPLRYRPPGYASMAHIVVSQMVSRASADAIWARLADLVPDLTPESIGSVEDHQLRGIGLSGGKIKTLKALAEACRSGLDLASLAGREETEALAQLTRIRGIGPWSAEVYLLFCGGHPDIFPAGDVALQKAAAWAFDLPVAPDARSLRMMAETWKPLRSVAARLLWAYYARRAGRNASPAPEFAQS